MKFHLADDCPEKGLVARQLSENGLVEVGIYQVLYGWRVRAGFVADRFGCVLDWCCGDSDKFLNGLYCSLLTILERRREDEDCFEGLPRTSDVKPAYKSPSFMQRIENLLQPPKKRRRGRPPRSKRERQMFRAWSVRCPECGRDFTQPMANKLKDHRPPGKEKIFACPGSGKRPRIPPVEVGEGVAVKQ